jgi:hypothetical protein
MDDLTTPQMPTAKPQPEGAPAPAPESSEPAEATVTLDNEEAFDATETLLLLLAGALLEGNDALQERLRRWRDETDSIVAAEAAVPAQSARSLRHALMGMLLDSPLALRRQWVLAGRFTHTFFALATLPLRPVAGSRLLRSAARRFDDLVAEGESTVAEWMAAGQAEEPRARALAQRATNDLIDDVIRHLSENPELAEMVQTQSVSLAGEVTDSIRARTVTADTAVERVARALLRRERLQDNREVVATEVTEVEERAGR